ncbi:MAG: amino acid ABC transporter substrate-binding protein [Hylemonella sp.]
MDKIRRKLLGATSAAALVAGLSPAGALANTPVKIGFSMPLTGGLGGGGQASLLALKIWAEDVNARGGLLGRKVELVYFDDQGNPANSPGIYTKLLDIDKVDLLFAPYATVPTAPIMPLVKQRNKLLMGNFSFQVNDKTKHDMWFNNAPWNTAEDWSKGFLEAGRAAGGKTAAILAEDLEFSQNLANGARPYFKAQGLNIVYDQNFPPSTKDFSSLVRAIRASNAEVVFIASYPASSAAIVNSIAEIGLGPQVKIVGGGMVGLQFTPIAVNLGSKLNGIVNYHAYVPGMALPGVEAFLKRYTVRAKAEKIDELGFYLPPFSYAIGEMLEQAVKGTKSLDDRKLADYLRKNEMKTIVGPVRYDANGERSNPRVIMAQFRGLKDKDQEQFRSRTAQVVLSPAGDKTGEFIAPYSKAASAK